MAFGEVEGMGVDVEGAVRAEEEVGGQESRAKQGTQVGYSATAARGWIDREVSMRIRRVMQRSLAVG